MTHDITNETRAERARIALQGYVEAKGEVFENSSSEVADLVADLLHLSAEIDEGDEPVESTLRLARMHFEVEHGNPDEEAGEINLGVDPGASDDPLEIDVNGCYSLSIDEDKGDLSIRVYPISSGQPWDCPAAVFELEAEEVRSQEDEDGPA